MISIFRELSYCCDKPTKSVLVFLFSTTIEHNRRYVRCVDCTGSWRDAAPRHRHMRQAVVQLPAMRQAPINLSATFFNGVYTAFLSGWNHTVFFCRSGPTMQAKAGPRSAGTFAGSINFHHEMTQPRPKHVVQHTRTRTQQWQKRKENYIVQNTTFW